MNAPFSCIEYDVNFVASNNETAYKAVQLFKDTASKYNFSLSLVSNVNEIRNKFSDTIKDLVNNQEVELYKVDITDSSYNESDRDIFLLYDKQKRLSLFTLLPYNSNFSMNLFSPYFLSQCESFIKDLIAYLNSEGQPDKNNDLMQKENFVFIKSVYDTGLIYIPGSLFVADFNISVGTVNLKTEVLLQGINCTFLYKNCIVEISSPPTPFFKPDAEQNNSNQSTPHRLFFLDTGGILHNQFSLKELFDIHSFWIRTLFKQS